MNVFSRALLHARLGLAWRLDAYFTRRITSRRPPDKTIGDPTAPYLLRWYITPWRGWYESVKSEDATQWQRFVKAAAKCLPNIYLAAYPAGCAAISYNPGTVISGVLCDNGTCVCQGLLLTTTSHIPPTGTGPDPPDIETSKPHKWVADSMRPRAVGVRMEHIAYFYDFAARNTGRILVLMRFGRVRCRQ